MLEAILLAIDGIGAGTSTVMLFVTVIRGLRAGWVRNLGVTAFGIVLAAAGPVWLFFLVIVGVGSTFNDFLPITSSAGDQVIVDQDPFDGDVVSVWTPHWGPFSEPTVVSELAGSHAVRRGDCSLVSLGATRSHVWRHSRHPRASRQDAAPTLTRIGPLGTAIVTSRCSRPLSCASGWRSNGATSRVCDEPHSMEDLR